MTPQLAQSLAIATGALAGVLCAVLFGYKSLRWWSRRRYGLRRALYITAIGEIIARDVDVSGFDGWPEDPAFVDVVVEFMEVVAGDERHRLEDIIRRTELRRRLVDQLGARSARTRLAAVSRLAPIADHTVTHALSAALDDPVTEVRIQAAHGLGVAGDESAIERLVRMLVTEDPWVAARVSDQIVVFGTRAVPILLDTIRDGHSGATVDPSTVEIVGRVLGIIGDLRASAPLVALLEHPEPEVRIVSASSLASCGTLESVPALVRAAADPDWRVRARAAASLAVFSDPSTLDVLRSCLEDESWWVRQNAAESLTEIPGGTGLLIETVEAGSEDARLAALMYLGLSGHVSAARHRVDDGTATPEDRRLTDLVDGLGIDREPSLR